MAVDHHWRDAKATAGYRSASCTRIHEAANYMRPCRTDPRSRNMLGRIVGLAKQWGFAMILTTMNGGRAAEAVTTYCAPSYTPEPKYTCRRSTVDLSFPA